MPIATWDLALSLWTSLCISVTDGWIYGLWFNWKLLAPLSTTGTLVWPPDISRQHGSIVPNDPLGHTRWWGPVLPGGRDVCLFSIFLDRTNWGDTRQSALQVSFPHHTREVHEEREGFPTEKFKYFEILIGSCDVFSIPQLSKVIDLLRMLFTYPVIFTRPGSQKCEQDCGRAGLVVHQVWYGWHRAWTRLSRRKAIRPPCWTEWQKVGKWLEVLWHKSRNILWVMLFNLSLHNTVLGWL